MLMYALLDRKLKEFQNPVTGASDEHVIRSLLDALRGTGALMEQHPEDFDLYRIGEYNPENGCLSGNVPVLVGSLIDMMAAQFRAERAARRPFDILREEGANGGPEEA